MAFGILPRFCPIGWYSGEGSVPLCPPGFCFGCAYFRLRTQVDP
jgi:hypothetical protein